MPTPLVTDRPRFKRVRHRTEPERGSGIELARGRGSDRRVLVKWDDGPQQFHDRAEILPEGKRMKITKRQLRKITSEALSQSQRATAEYAAERRGKTSFDSDDAEIPGEKSPHLAYGSPELEAAQEELQMALINVLADEGLDLLPDDWEDAWSYAKDYVQDTWSG